MSSENPTPVHAGLTTSAVSDAVGILWSPQATSAQGITETRCITPDKVVSGPAYTIRISPARTEDPESRSNLFRAYRGAPAGAVVVVQVVGEVGGAVMGDVVADMLQRNGIAGLVVDGAIRDVSPLRAMGFPVWAREITMRAIRTKQIITEVGVDITVAGTPVRPGDVVVADDDGVFVVPQEAGDRVFHQARQIMESEADSHAQLAAGVDILQAYAPLPAAAVTDEPSGE